MVPARSMIPFQLIANSTKVQIRQQRMDRTQFELTGKTMLWTQYGNSHPKVIFGSECNAYQQIAKPDFSGWRNTRMLKRLPHLPFGCKLDQNNSTITPRIKLPDSRFSHIRWKDGIEVYE